VAVNTVLLILSSITGVLGWAWLKLGNFKKFKVYQGLTILFAMIFLCVKSYEYHDKFIHYEVVMKSGKIADGHINKAETTAEKVVLEGRIVDSHAELMERAKES